MFNKTLVLFMLLAVGLFLAPQVSRSRAQSDALSVVQSYQVLHNSEDVDGVMALFTSDAEFEYVGQGTIAGDALRAIHEYDRSIHSRLAFINCEPNDDTVVCQAVEFNDWLDTAGLQPVFYTSSEFTVVDGHIAHIRATMSPDSAQALGATLETFIPWLMQNRSAEAAPLFGPDGAFIYSGANGELVVQLLHEWREDTMD